MDFVSSTDDLFVSSRSDGMKTSHCSSTWLHYPPVHPSFFVNVSFLVFLVQLNVYLYSSDTFAEQYKLRQVALTRIQRE